MLGLLIVMFYALFRVHRLNNYHINLDSIASLFAIEVTSVLLGWFVYSSLDIKDDEIFTIFVMLPLIVGTLIFFIGNFISNNYRFFVDQD